MCVERKSVADLISSLNSGRLWVYIPCIFSNFGLWPFSVQYNIIWVWLMKHRKNVIQAFHPCTFIIQLLGELNKISLSTISIICKNEPIKIEQIIKWMISQIIRVQFWYKISASLSLIIIHQKTSLLNLSKFRETILLSINVFFF